MTSEPKYRGWSGAWLPLVVWLAVAPAGCDFPGRPNPQDRPVPSDQVRSFELLFEEHCSGCHGAEGRLGPAPPLNDPLFLAIAPVGDLLATICDGRPGTPMPAFARGRGGPLTADQAKILADGLKPRWGRTLLGKELLPTYAVAAERPANAGSAAERGAKIFTRACAECHGNRGQGLTMGAGALNDRAFLGLISDQALRRIIITGRPDLGMPDFASSRGRGRNFAPLSSDEIVDLVALLARWRQGRAIPDQDFQAEESDLTTPPGTD